MPGTDGAPPSISLPRGKTVELAGRGTTFIRELRGPKHAPAVVLLHGLGVDADLNWFSCYHAFAERYRVVAIDHRGHGRGIALDGRRFRLADCADDVAALCDVLGIDQVVPVGYSMGGPIAQLLWHRHRDLVAGMVLCATAGRFPIPPFARMVTTRLAPGVAAAARFTSNALPSNPIVRQLIATRYSDAGVREWVLRRERLSDPRAVVQAAGALGRYDATGWLPAVDVPTAVVVTRFDRLISRSRQEELGKLVPTAVVHPVMGDHGVVATRPDLFLPAATAALQDVLGR